MAQTLLVNFWYAAAVGHAIEALRYCLGYHRADPGLEISLLLNETSATELTKLCPFVRNTYCVSYPFTGGSQDPLQALRDVPRRWDWVLDDARRLDSRQLALFPNLARYYEASDVHFDAATARGIVGNSPPSYTPNQPLFLDARREGGPGTARYSDRPRPHIAVILAGGGPRHFYPSLSSWRLIIKRLLARWPAATIFLIGKHRTGGGNSASISRSDVDAVLSEFPGSVDCFDAPLVEQLHLLAGVDVLLSPHTGFGMAALAVGTPWLILSGNGWPEYFFNGVPFYSVIPDGGKYPCYTELEGAPPSIPEDSDGEGPRTLSMSAARIAEDLEEISAGAELLIRRGLGYEEALRRHVDRMLLFYRGDASKLCSFDNALGAYVKSGIVHPAASPVRAAGVDRPPAEP